jgi:FkbM family methyltransferase
VAAALCSKGDTIIEIGANVGTETVGFRDIVGSHGRIVAFEPLPSNVQALNDLKVLNGWSNVDVFPFAVGDAPKTVEFVPPPNKHTSGVGHIACGPRTTSPQTLPVDCVSLDSFAEKLGKARAIFCDAEGLDVQVLSGARAYLARHQPAMSVESFPRLLQRAGSSVEELFSQAHEAGYEVFRIWRFGVSLVMNLAGTRPCNWLLLPKQRVVLARRCSRSILTCAVLPCVLGLNPLCRKHSD